MVKHGVNEGFVRPGHLDLFVVADNLPDLLDAMNHYRGAPEGKWLSHDNI